MEADDTEVNLTQDSYAYSTWKRAFRYSCCRWVILAIAVAVGVIISILTLLILLWAFVVLVGLMALHGIYLQVSGQLILSVLQLDGYDSPLQSSMQIGATGGAILWLIIAAVHNLLTYYFSYNLLGHFFPSPAEKNTHYQQDVSYPASLFQRIFGLCWTTVFGAIMGAIGSEILVRCGLEVMGPLRAASAGALGGAFMGPGLVFGEAILHSASKILPCKCRCLGGRSINEPGYTANRSFISASLTLPFAAKRATVPEEAPIEPRTSQHAVRTSEYSLV